MKEIENNYLEVCRLSIENFLLLESRLFFLLNNIYVWDNWEQKKHFYSLDLGNLFIGICVGIEESLKLLIQNPINPLQQEFIKHLPSQTEREKNIIKEVKKGDYSNIKLTQILDFLNFREKLKEGCKKILYIRPPLQLQMPEALFGQKDKKPEFYDIFEKIKHNIFTAYKSATIEVIFVSIGAYYLVAKTLSYEASVYEPPNDKREKYIPWYNGNFDLDNTTSFSTSKHWVSHFKSENFFNIKIKHNPQE